ncbi:ABC transporter permease [Dehalogenimonas etheniformans]|uniref:ABC transporter permease n=1 Tax=Dehalogenimonas etheniformans TaxID=1536648 RepID=A0A2P5P880_9CHLR|nr:ABC transporter permease [Dehalogenimonas etheniformans]PPD58513.1 ABC transporter permease [Dehalogenimonas etheniformans]QNT76723.1 ABC transporter permease [Dehalogenimonas etheniformans]
MSKKQRPIAKQPETRWIWLGLFTALFILVVSNDTWWRDAFGFLFPSQTEALHPRAPLRIFLWEHLRMVGISSFLSMAIGIPLGILTTRAWGKTLNPLVGHLTSLGQTFPPIAVLALAVPALGFGLKPAVLALFLYGLFPIVSSTSVALSGVPLTVLDSARGMGMTPVQSLFRVEIPLGLPVILGGIRISVMVNIGTAMIGALIGAGGLGSPVIAGLIQFNPAFILEGTLPAAFMAILASEFITTLELSAAHQPEPATAS